MENITTITIRPEDIESLRACSDIAMPYNFQGNSPVSTSPASLEFQLTLGIFPEDGSNVRPHVRTIIERVAAEHESGLRYLADK